ncbi:MAG: hypothetical protein LC808_27540 [Actinobacteria bacterium]|nr:hypothetical protein [Actinomycetota bacterium]
MNESEAARWEYRTVSGRAGVEYDIELNRLAREGWEAIGIAAAAVAKTFWKAGLIRTTALLRRRLR